MSPCADTPAPPDLPDLPDPAELVAALIHSRQTILPRRLSEPGPDATQLALIVTAAGAAPDHGQLVPWRFVIVPQAARGALAEAFAQALLERDPGAEALQLAQARDKAYRAPLLLLAVARLGVGNPDIDASERLLSAGCALQNMLLSAHALGFGAALTGGKALKSSPLRTLFALQDSEQALCFISIGTALQRRPARLRPGPAAYLSVLGEPAP